MSETGRNAAIMALWCPCLVADLARRRVREAGCRSKAGGTIGIAAVSRWPTAASLLIPAFYRLGRAATTTDGWREGVPPALRPRHAAAPPAATARTGQIQNRSLPSPVTAR
jgi:hypothetical protein